MLEQVKAFRGQSSDLAAKLDLSQNHLLQLQELLGNRDENIRILEEQLHETQTNQNKSKQEAQLQAEELTMQIKVLQDQLLHVRLFLTLHN